MLPDESLNIPVFEADIKEIERKVNEYMSTRKTGIVRYEINFYKGGITTKKIKHEVARQNK